MSLRPDQRFDYRHVGYGFLAACALAVLGFLGLLVGALVDVRQFAFSYLFAFVFFFTISLGALFWVIVHHAVDAEWSVVMRRQLENVACLFSALAVLFIPLVFVAPVLWAWMDPANAGNPVLLEKAAYLNRPFFWGRTLVYFAVFIGSAWLLRAYSVAQDASGLARCTICNRRVAFASVIPFALCVTFAAIDWLMSLDWHWFSTIWGVYLFAGAALSSLCVLALVVTALRSVGYFPNTITEEHYHILGKLLLAFTIFWAYIGFSQYMLVWYANIPEETSYYILRNTGSWNVLSILLVLGHFVVPFLLLLPGAGKRRPGFLCGVAWWILAMHLLDVYLMVLPELHRTGFRPSLLDVLAVLAIGSTLVAAYLKALGDSALYPIHDPRLQQSIDLQN